MEAAPKKRGPKKSKPAASLTEDVIVKILRRLPVRSVCRFKCVSRSWYKLISNPDNGVPQTLAGFFYDSWNGERFPCRAYHFTNVTGKGAPLIYPSFSFLPVPRKDVMLEDSFNGLLLCRYYESGPSHVDTRFHYVVCNPAMKKWQMLWDSSRAAGEYRTVRLGFDPTVSSHFHVMEYVVDLDECIIGVEIYSSKTAVWSFKESEWGDDVMLDNTSISVFLNGFMHMLTYSHGIIVVDMEGMTWRKIPVPDSGEFLAGEGLIHQSHGHLLYFDADDYAYKLSVWILEDYSTDEWTKKYTISTRGLFGGKKLQFDIDYQVIAVHPECNLVFFVYGWDKTLMAYEMDRREVRVIRNLGHESERCFLPYVPFFSDSLAEEH